MNDLTNKFWDEHFRNVDLKELKGIKLKVYNWLNRGNFGGFGLIDNYFWIEKTASTSSLPNYIYNYMKKWAIRNGYKSNY